MPQPLIVVLTVVLCAYVFAAPLKHGFAALIAAVVLIPSTLVIPNGVTSLLGVDRLVTLSYLVSLIVRIRRRQIPMSAVRMNRIHAVMASVLVVTLINGVILAHPATDTASSFADWSLYVEQFVFFGTVLIALRAIDDLWWVTKAIAVIAIASGTIAFLEHFLHGSWARWFFEDQQELLIFNSPLEKRSGGLRVRAASEFALQFAWVGLMLLGFVLVFAARARRRRVFVGLGVLGLAIYWSYSRSSGLGILVVLATVLFVSGVDRRVVRLTFVILALVGFAYFVRPSLGTPFQGQRGSTDARVMRAQDLGQVVAQRPYQGMGLSGLIPFNVNTTDNSYVHTYGELGVVGLTALGVLMFTAVASTLPALRAPPGRERLIAAAALSGVAAGWVASAAFDLITLGESARILWLCTAMAVAIGDRAPRSARVAVGSTLGVRVRWRLALVVAAFGAAVALNLVAPHHSAVQYNFETLSVVADSFPATDVNYIGLIKVKTACGMADAIAQSMPGVKVQCRDVGGDRGAGVGQLRIQARDPVTLQQSVDRLADGIRSLLPPFRLDETMPVTQGRSTWIRTSYVWLTEAALACALLIPIRRRRVPGPGVGVRSEPVPTPV